MPGKKGKKGKSSKKKGKKSKGGHGGTSEKRDPMVPEYVPPPPWPGQQVETAQAHQNKVSKSLDLHVDL